MSSRVPPTWPPGLREAPGRLAVPRQNPFPHDVAPLFHPPLALLNRRPASGAADATDATAPSRTLNPRCCSWIPMASSRVSPSPRCLAPPLMGPAMGRATASSPHPSPELGRASLDRQRPREKGRRATPVALCLPCPALSFLPLLAALDLRGQTVVYLPPPCPVSPLRNAPSPLFFSPSSPPASKTFEDDTGGHEPSAFTPFSVFGACRPVNRLLQRILGNFSSAWL